MAKKFGKPRSSNQVHVASMCLGPVQFPKNFLQYLSHRIFEHMHKALNVVKKINNDTV